MRSVAILVLLAFTLSSCGGSSPGPPAADFTLPQLAVTGSVSGPDLFTDASALALSGSSPVLPLFAVSSIPTNQGNLNLEFWGTKDSAGNILQLTEAGVSGLPQNGSIHVFFDTSNRPVLFRSDDSGFSIDLSYQSATQTTLTIRDQSNTAVGQAQITFTNNVPAVTNVSDGGSCRLVQAAAAVRPAAKASVATGAPTTLSSLANIAKLITAGTYVAGMGFAIGAILKFKAHKDNPSQLPISLPIVLLFVAAALIFIPSIFSGSPVLFTGLSASAPGASGFPPFIPESALPGCVQPSLVCPFPSPEPTP